MRALFLAALLATRRPGGREGRGRGDDRGAGPAGRRSAHDRGRVGAVRLRPGRVPLAGRRQRWLFRTHAVAGRWSSWRPVAPEAEDLPDPGSGRRDPQGLAARQPYWVGASDRVAYRVVGDVRRLRVWYVWSPVERASLRAPSMTGAPDRAATGVGGERGDHPRDAAVRVARLRLRSSITRPARTPTPGASPPRSCAGSSCTTSAETAGTTSATTSSSTRYGQVFEGRAGGIERNVIGAHAEGFNTGSTGVAVIGNYSATRISPAALHALVGLLAWRLDVAHVDPLSTLTWRSGGNPGYRAGREVKLRAISGHRDTGPTSCPGAALYSRLPDIARAVALTGLPKLYAPQVVGGLGGSVRFTARLSAPAAWTVTVRAPPAPSPRAAAGLERRSPGHGTLLGSRTARTRGRSRRVRRRDRHRERSARRRRRSRRRRLLRSSPG